MTVYDKTPTYEEFVALKQRLGRLEEMFTVHRLDPEKMRVEQRLYFICKEETCGEEQLGFALDQFGSPHVTKGLQQFLTEHTSHQPAGVEPRSELRVYLVCECCKEEGYGFRIDALKSVNALHRFLSRHMHQTAGSKPNPTSKEAA